MLESIYTDDMHEKNYLLEKTLLKYYDIEKSQANVLIYINEYKRAKAKCVNSTLVDNLKSISINLDKITNSKIKSNATFANNIDNILDAEGVVNMFNPIFEKIKETMTKKEKKYFDFCIFSKCSEEYFRDKICNGLSRNGLAPIKDSCIMKLALGLNVEVLK